MNAVFFDLDGCLVDSRAPFVACINAALERHGAAPRPPAELHPLIGPPIHETFERFVAAELVEPCVIAYRERYAANGVAETIVFDGIPTVLDELAGRCVLAVATSKSQALAEQLLTGLGLADRFAQITGSDIAVAHESKTTTLRRAVARLDGPAVAMVGDRRYDIEAAHACGLRAVGVLWGAGTREELTAAGADVLVRDPAGLLATL